MASGANAEIVSTIRSLRKDNPIRLQAELVLANPSARIENLQPILRSLASKRFRKRSQITTAAWIISNANWSDEQRARLSWELCGSLLYAMSGWKSFGFAQLKWLNPIFFAGVLSTYCMYYSGVLSGLTCVILVVYLLAGVTMGEREAYSKLIQSRLILNALGELQQPASLGTIAAAMKRAAVRDAAASALVKVTASLQSQHYGSLPSPTVPALCEAISVADPKTIIVILQALSIIGDGRAIKDVERLALKSPTPEIGRAASDLLPILYQRALENKSATQLLRSSGASQNGELELLRGVIGRIDNAPEVLVRATVASENELL
jgi:hypothetical protein